MSSIPKELIDKMIKHKVWDFSCPVDISRLQYLQVPYCDFDYNHHSNGEIIVLDIIADEIQNIFFELEKEKFPIARIKTMDYYQGDDEKSMKNNNSSAFNFRHISGSDRLSIHSYGLAVDINPVQNPYILCEKTNKVHPAGGEKFIDRSQNFPGMITNKEVSIFKKNKMVGWGGNWSNPKDWQHFEIPRHWADKIIKMSYSEGKKYLAELF